MTQTILEAGPITGFTTTSSTFVDVTDADLEFTPDSTDENWVVMVSGFIGNSNTELGGANVQVDLNGVDQHRSQASWSTGGASDLSPFSTFFSVTGTTSLQTVQVQARHNSNDTCYIEDVFIVAFRVPDDADFQYAAELGTPNREKSVDGNTPLSIMNITWTPSSSGDYVFFGACCFTEHPSNNTADWWLRTPDGTDVPDQGSALHYQNGRQALYALIHIAEEDGLAASSQTFDMMVISGQSHAEGSNYPWRHMMCMRKDAWDLVEETISATESSTTSSSYQEKVALTTAAPPAERDYLVCMGLRLEQQNNSGQRSGELRRSAAAFYESTHDHEQGVSSTAHQCGRARTETGAITYSAGAKASSGTTLYGPAYIFSFRFPVAAAAGDIAPVLASSRRQQLARKAGL